MIENGYIKLHRKIMTWRWYTHPLTKHLFEHLLLIANIDDGQLGNITIKRGQCVTSLRLLSYQTGLSLKEVRTALKHLKETQEVAQLSSPQGTIITVLNYDEYQSGAHTTAHEGHTRGTAGAHEGHYNKKNKKNKKNKEEKENISPLGSSMPENPEEEIEIVEIEEMEI